MASLQGRVRAVAIKKSFELAPWADVVYGCDAPWWRGVVGLPGFSGLKLAYDDGIVGQYGIRKVCIEDKHLDEILTEKTGYVGSGGNSGFQALNLVVQFGARRILLAGVDAHGEPGREHWYGRNNWNGTNNPSRENYRRWARAFYSCAPVLQSMGVDVVNLSRESSIKCFRHSSAEEAMREWGQ